MTSVANKLFGVPPGPGAARIERLRWVRRFYLRPLPLVVIVYTLGVTSVRSPVEWALLGTGALLWIQGFASLSLRIKREQRHAGDRSADERS